MDATQVGLIITALTPIVVPLLITLIKKIPLPTWTLPLIATGLGVALDTANHYATGGGLGPLMGAVLGAAGVGLREIVDQLKQTAVAP